MLPRLLTKWLPYFFLPPTFNEVITLLLLLLLRLLTKWLPYFSLPPTFNKVLTLHIHKYTTFIPLLYHCVAHLTFNPVAIHQKSHIPHLTHYRKQKMLFKVTVQTAWPRPYLSSTTQMVLKVLAPGRLFIQATNLFRMLFLKGTPQIIKY